MNARGSYHLGNQSSSFFKDRNWLRLEFPELLECAKADAGPKLVVEIGCVSRSRRGLTAPGDRSDEVNSGCVHLLGSREYCFPLDEQE
jgi:hypothetical protein